MKPLPRHSRTAGIEDNMQSPEQNSPSEFEPDVHQMVRQFFNQDVMEETNTDSHHVGLPGFEVIEEEMNKVDNMDDDAVTNTLFPVGANLMAHDDTEVDATGSQSKMNLEDCTLGTSETVDSWELRDGTGQVSSNGEGSELAPPSQPSPVEMELDPVSGLLVPIVNQPGPITRNYPYASTVDPDSGLLIPVPNQNNPVFRSIVNGNNASPILSSLDGDELAMPLSNAHTHDSEEIGDLQDTVPKVSVELESELPPSPNPIPVPVVDIVPVQSEPEDLSRQVLACMVVLQTAGRSFSDMNLAQTEASVKMTAKFDATDVKGNFLSLVSHCTRAASDNFDGKAVKQFSATLSKYASALSCAESENFPACVPSEASKIIQEPPQNGNWNCF